MTANLILTLQILLAQEKELASSCQVEASSLQAQCSSLNAQCVTLALRVSHERIIQQALSHLVPTRPFPGTQYLDPKLENYMEVEDLALEPEEQVEHPPHEQHSFVAPQNLEVGPGKVVSSGEVTEKETEGGQ